MLKDDLLSRLLGCLGMGQKSISFWRFRDGLGNFEIFVPEGWKYDEDIAVVDGKYTISFQSPDKLCQFTISIDAQLPDDFRFSAYAKAELESPESGIYASVKKSRFHGMPAYVRDYSYTDGRSTFFGGGVMFFARDTVFSLSWSGPSSKRTILDAVFSHMRKTLVVRHGFVITRKKPKRGRK